MKPLSELLMQVPVSATAEIDRMAKHYIAEGRDVILFSVGEPDFATPAHIKDAGIRAIQCDATHYTPVTGTQSLKMVIRDAHLAAYGVSYQTDEIAVTSGGKLAIYATMRALINPGDEVILPAPYWTSYAQIIRLSGGVPIVIPCKSENGFLLTASQLQAAVTEKTKALILNNPNNPSGAVYDRQAQAALAAIAEQNDLYVLADEMYAALVYDGMRFTSFASLNSDTKARCVTINGVSKSYAMTGWRIGYAAGDARIIRGIEALMSHSAGCPNSIAQLAAEEALTGSHEAVERMRNAYEGRRNCMLSRLNAIDGVHCRVPQGAFYVLLDVRGYLDKANGETDGAFALALLQEAGVALVPCAEFGLPGFVRLAYTQTEPVIIEGIARLRRFLEKRRKELTQ